MCIYFNLSEVCVDLVLYFEWIHERSKIFYRLFKLAELKLMSFFTEDVTVTCFVSIRVELVLPIGAVVKNTPANAGDARYAGSIFWVRKIPWNKKRQPIPVLLPGASHGQRSLAGYSAWGCKEPDMTEHTHTPW